MEKTLDLKRLADMTHYAHSLKVSQISGLLARYAGFPSDEAAVIEHAALFHDIGKNYIPESVLNKPARLTPEEYELVKTHTSLAHEQLSGALRVLAAADVIASFHHERWNGNGGYLGLRGNDIHEYARLVAVCDVYDALASKRSYKSAWAINDVCGYMEQNAGTMFDPKYVALLLKLIGPVTALYEEK